mgnify:CR=1 FL=1
MRKAIIVGSGVAGLTFNDEVETVNARGALLEHGDLAAISMARGASALLEAVVVEAGQVGLLFRDGRHEATLAAGVYGLWKGVARAKVLTVELREQVLDVAGQEIMTADKVTLRLNAVVTYKIADPLVAVTAVEDYRQALYREAQLVREGRTLACWNCPSSRGAPHHWL